MQTPQRSLGTDNKYSVNFEIWYRISPHLCYKIMNFQFTRSAQNDTVIYRCEYRKIQVFCTFPIFGRKKREQYTTTASHSIKSKPEFEVFWPLPWWG